MNLSAERRFTLDCEKSLPRSEAPERRPVDVSALEPVGVLVRQRRKPGVQLDQRFGFAVGHRAFGRDEEVDVAGVDEVAGSE